MTWIECQVVKNGTFEYFYQVLTLPLTNGMPARLSLNCLVDFGSVVVLGT